MPYLLLFARVDVELGVQELLDTLVQLHVGLRNKPETATMHKTCIKWALGVRILDSRRVFRPAPSMRGQTTSQIAMVGTILKRGSRVTHMMARPDQPPQSSRRGECGPAVA